MKRNQFVIMCSNENKKGKLHSNKNVLSALYSVEYWKSNFPSFFDENVRVKLNRLKICSHENQSSDASDPKHSSKSTDNSSFIRVTRSKNKRNVSVDWCRISKGDYRGDIAKVDFLDEKSNEAHLKLLPRINYGAFNKNLEGEPSKRRPLPKVFDPNALR